MPDDSEFELGKAKIEDAVMGVADYHGIDVTVTWSDLMPNDRCKLTVASDASKLERVFYDHEIEDCHQHVTETMGMFIRGMGIESLK